MSLFFHKNLEGKQINGLTFLAFISKHRTARSYWLVQCVCSNVFISRYDAITSERTKSCGCLQKQLSGTAGFIHGFSRDHGNPLKIDFFKTYTAMKQRCLNPRNPMYPDYGGRGIKICKRWLGKMGFIYFMKDMWDEYLKRRLAGEKISIERIKVNRGYKPSNCKWATDLEQGRNKRISVRSIDIDAHNYWKRKIAKMVSYNLHFNNGKRPSKIVEKYVGCTVEFLRAYMQSKFKKGMSWDNYGHGNYKWQIDHITPFHDFDLAIEKNRYKCFHFSNCQPLWGWENNEKH